MAGAPKGNKNSAVGKQGRYALELALRHYEPGKSVEDVEVVSTIKTLVMMWWPIITNAMENGDLQAMKEINDRLDGRAAQSLTISGDEENPVVITKVERVIVKPTNTDS